MQVVSPYNVQIYVKDRTPVSLSLQGAFAETHRRGC